MKESINCVGQAYDRAGRMAVNLQLRVKEQLENQHGQGTTEYAILVGVLVVIAIVAIVAFRPKIAELWDSIVTAIEKL